MATEKRNTGSKKNLQPQAKKSVLTVKIIGSFTSLFVSWSGAIFIGH